MDIMTADGPKDFYRPTVPEFPQAHVAAVRELVNFHNSPTVAGWNLRFMPYPRLDLEEQIRKQVVLTHVPQCLHPNDKRIS